MSYTSRPSSYHRSSPKLKPSFPDTVPFTLGKPKRSESSLKLCPQQPPSPLKLYQIDFDYGKLCLLRSTIQQAPARTNTPVKHPPTLSQKPSTSSISKHSTFSTKAKLSTRSRYSNSKQSSTQHPRRRNTPLEINPVNLKFDQMFNPDEEKRNKTRRVTMLVGGKIVDRVITYPDTSHYLKLCRIKNT